MEGVPVNALAEWKARKETEAGGALGAVGSTGKRPIHSYAVITEADIQAALVQHKILMKSRDQPAAHVSGFPPFMGGPPPFPPNG
jgi:hypothetical protein